MQQNLDNINNNIAELEKLKQQIQNRQNQPAINQTFQLAPTNQNSMRYANTIEDVNKEMVTGDTPFFSKDLSIVWIKNAKGEVKSYELTEIIIKDDKDIMIGSLQSQINELKGMIKNEHNTNTNEPVKSSQSSSISSNSTSTKKQK
jgi:hypothetical protein